MLLIEHLLFFYELHLYIEIVFLNITLLLQKIKNSRQTPTDKIKFQIDRTKNRYKKSTLINNKYCFGFNVLNEREKVINLFLSKSN